MRTTIITFVLILFGLTLHGQVQLEHTYNFSGTLTEIDEGEFKYFVMDVSLKQCRLYNEDHTLYKSIDLVIPTDYYLYDIKFVSRSTFNSDDYIELLYIYYKYEVINNTGVYYYGMKVVNELGNQLMSLPNGAFAELKKGSGETKLLAYQYIWYDYYYLVYTNIYALGGSTKSAFTESTAGLKLFPNPVTDLLNVKPDPVMVNSGGQIVINDISGRQILSQPLLPGMETQQINIQKMEPGTYILSFRNDQGERVAGKFEKK